MSPSKVLRTAGDVMRRAVLTVHEDDDVWELARLFSERRITGAPVLDDDDKLVGVVSQTDIVRHLKEMALARREGDGWFEQAEAEGSEPALSLATAGDIMSREIVQAAETTPLSKLSRMMLRRRVHRVIITSRGRLAGIVTTMDVLRAL